MSDGVEVNETGASPPLRPERELLPLWPDLADGGALGRDLAEGGALGRDLADGAVLLAVAAGALATPMLAAADAAGPAPAAVDDVAPGARPTPVREAAAGAAAMGFFVDTEDTGRPALLGRLLKSVA